MKCSIATCESRSRTRGYCVKHYSRLLATGSAETPLKRYRNPEESFKSRCRQTETGCVVWSGSLATGGYGMMSANGKKVRAHRYAWERVNGPIPDGLVIDHICGNRACVNVDHLRPTTRKQNNENRIVLESTNKSGYNGVSWDKGTRKWRATAYHQGKTIYVGCYVDVEEAAQAARDKRIELLTHNERDRQSA